MKTRRPNLLQFNDWMNECVQQLERSPHQTDQHLAVWFELQRITDEAMSSFGLDDTSASSPLTESRVQAVLRWFDKRMEGWRKSTPDDMLTGEDLPVERQWGNKSSGSNDDVSSKISLTQETSYAQFL